MAKPYKVRNSRFYWISPTINGIQVDQSSKETDYVKAERKLKILEGKIASNAAITATMDRGSVGHLLTLVIKNYELKQFKTIKDAQRRIDLHLIPAFGHLPAGKFISDAEELWADYVGARRKHINKKGEERPASNASINLERSLILRAYALGKRGGWVSTKPYLEKLDTDNRREGFFEEAQFRMVLGHSNPLLKDFLILAYYTGWRSKSILKLEWSQIDFVGKVIRLTRKGTKNKKSTIFPLEPFPELLAMLQARFDAKKVAEKELRRIIPAIFYRENGEAAKDLKQAWQLTRIRAGLPGKLIHDFRRTAVRRLKKIGFAESEIMDMVGFKTRAMFDHYDITVEEDILAKTRLIMQATAR